MFNYMGKRYGMTSPIMFYFQQDLVRLNWSYENDEAIISKEYAERLCEMFNMIIKEKDERYLQQMSRLR
jgi:hypothetical protein